MPVTLKSNEIALWFIENTSLTFEKIAATCDLDIATVQDIADEEIVITKSINPIELNLITMEKIKDIIESSSNSKIQQMELNKKPSKQKNPCMSKRQKKPCAIAWLLKNCPGISVNNIVNLVGTTANTVRAIENRTHWNINKIEPSYKAVEEVCDKNQLQHIIFMSKISADHNSILSKIDQNNNC